MTPKTMIRRHISFPPPPDLPVRIRYVSPNLPTFGRLAAETALFSHFQSVFARLSIGWSHNVDAAGPPGKAYLYKPISTPDDKGIDTLRATHEESARASW